MIAWIQGFISRHYNEEFEDFAVRLLYFFNTIDTYFLVAGIGSYLLWVWFGLGALADPLAGLLMVGAIWAAFKLADFYPLFLIPAAIAVALMFMTTGLDPKAALILLGLNLVAFLLIQVGFMGIPDSIVARDPLVAIRKIWNSVWTVAPTTVSLSMSVAFAWLLSVFLAARPDPLAPEGLLIWGLLFGGAAFTRLKLPKPYVSERFQPDPPGPTARRVIILNIDGCRLDKLKSLNHPFLNDLKGRCSHIPQGIQTVYRALTNPAFASILTGAPPKVHGIRSNNLGMTIQVPGLPDLTPTVLYGSMHVKHFSKPEWETRIVSLPRHGMRKSDDIMIDWLKEDLLTRPELRLFIADISETDFLGHAYGSDSQQYLEAMRRSVGQIEAFFGWLEEKGMMDDSVVIICSDHGMYEIDHSYLIADAERFAPFFIVGPGVRSGAVMTSDASIMDIAPTVAYLLGVPYPSHAEGAVLVEALDEGIRPASHS